MNYSWPHTESPFHAGELAIQANLGFQGAIDHQGRQMIREYLPEPFQAFLAQLSSVMVGTVDASGNLWASILTGAPGFLSSPDIHTLHIAAQPIVGDPITLGSGLDIGLLGIQLQTRRRIRLNGKLSAPTADGFAVQVGQCFGNCPQYIQVRSFELPDRSIPRVVHPISSLSTVKDFITASDTFFIATAYQDASAGRSGGVDVAHRGGKPGFVQVDDDQTLTIPDFSGNHHFNTFGNLVLNPRAGLLFIDFDRGHLLYLTGSAEVIWSGAEISTHLGAERLLRFHLDRGYHVEVNP